MEFVLIPAGSFPVEVQGDDGNVAGTASVSKPFYLGTYPVTQKQWESLMGNTPSKVKGPNKPVERVSWYDAQKFIRRLNAREGAAGYRLPTEMEWVFAARGGTDARRSFINDPMAECYKECEKKSGKSTQPVDKKKPNSYGLNYTIVLEWVQDWYDDLSGKREFTDYRGPATGTQRMARSRALERKADDCSPVDRLEIQPNVRSSAVGFRLAFSPEDADAGAVEVPAWSHHEKNYEIHSPKLSPDNKWLVFTRKLYSPDGAACYNYSEKELEQFRKRSKENPRIEDPEVVLVNMADKSVRFIDYGWGPVFSPDQKSILYARQTTPASGSRLVAAAFAGNEIQAYDLALEKFATVARPSAGSLSNPAFTDKGAVLCALTDAVNGAWGGNIGVGMADPETGWRKEVYAPLEDHGLYHLVHKFAMRDGVGLVLRARPLSAGVYMADTYAIELVDAEKGTVLHTWGEHKLSREMLDEVDFRICPSGGLEVYDGEWKAPAPGEAAESQGQEPKASGGLSSPDCAYVARISKDKESLTILSSRGEPERRWVAPGYIRSPAWSPDASHIVLVLSHGESSVDVRFEYDELVVVRVRDLPVNK
jgi:hypothetical protein